MALAIADVCPVPLHPVSSRVEVESLAVALPDDLTLAAWIDHGLALAARQSSVLWDIADWAAVGLARFGTDALPYLGAVTHRAPNTMRKMAHLATAFPPERRRAGVAFSHHALVMNLPASEADRLLDQATRERWRYRDLAGAVQALVGRRRPVRARRPRPERTLARSIIRPAATAAGDTAIRCHGCLQPVAFIVEQRAVLLRGASTLQRLGNGELVANTECGCGSTALISLAMFELSPTRPGLPGTAPVPRYSYAE